VETTGLTGNSADAFMDAMEQCYNTRMGDGAPGQFRKIKSAYFMELGMILARGSAKILRVARRAVRLRQQHNFGDVDEDGFYDAMGDIGEADGEFLRGDECSVPIIKSIRATCKYYCTNNNNNNNIHV
jgi:hypothetical protein